MDRAGEVVLFDWDKKQPLRSAPVTPSDPSIRDENRRGNSRGGRGIWITPTTIYVASYDQVQLYDHELRFQRSLSNGLVVGLHEVLMTQNDTLWVTATAIDALLEVEVSTGRICRSYWPRDLPSVQQEFGLTATEIDKSADQRAAFLSSAHLSRPSHLHLNASAMYEGEMLALLNRFGAIVNLDRGTVVIKDDALKGAHNLLIKGNLAVTNATRDASVRMYDLSSGRLFRAFDLLKYDWVRHQLFRAFYLHKYDKVRHRAGRSLVAFGARALWRLMRIPPYADPLFLRGLDLVDSQLFVGLSPASILRIDFETGTLVDAYQYSRDVRVSVHGIRAHPVSQG